MLKEANVPLDSNLQNILDALRNPESDSEMAETISIYKEAVQKQAAANVILAEIKDELSASERKGTTDLLINGFQNIVETYITKQLKDMKPTDRPIHCSDKKRLQFYVKDNDKWEKDEDNKKLDETIRDVKLKLPISLTEWEKANPTYKNDPKLMDEWMNIMTGISEGDTGNILKEKLALKRKLANYMELKEAMAQSQEEK